MIVPALFVGALFLVVFLRQPDGPGEWVFTGETMGTGFTVKVVEPAGDHPDRAVVEAAIRREVDAVDSTMSTYREDSDLSRFNRAATGPVEVDRGVIEVVTEAQRIAELTGGAFDITVGPLVDAWGFGPEPVAAPPTDDELEALTGLAGTGHVEVDPGSGTLRKDRPGIRCDLSAIAKGYAVDRVAEALIGLGFDDLMVEIGGEVRAHGRNAAGRFWRIGVERPQSERGAVWRTVEIVDAAMATSGDYRNYYERDGVRISHTIDPRTGRPIAHHLASVTVIHPSCMTADALATALTVLGPDDGRALVEREGLAALFLVRTRDGGFEEWTSDAWPDENTGGPQDVARTER